MNNKTNSTKNGTMNGTMNSTKNGTMTGSDYAKESSKQSGVQTQSGQAECHAVRLSERHAVRQAGLPRQQELQVQPVRPVHALTLFPETQTCAAEQCSTAHVAFYKSVSIASRIWRTRRISSPPAAGPGLSPAAESRSSGSQGGEPPKAAGSDWRLPAALRSAPPRRSIRISIAVQRLVPEAGGGGQNDRQVCRRLRQLQAANDIDIDVAAS